MAGNILLFLNILSMYFAGDLSFCLVNCNKISSCKVAFTLSHE